MNDYEVWEIAGHTLEYLDDIHQYIVDGIMVSSVTESLKIKFGNKYASVDCETLQRASERGTEVHETIEKYFTEGRESDLQELRNFKFLQKKYKFDVTGNEMPVILFDGVIDTKPIFFEDKPILAGRFDLLLDFDGKNALGDIKTTSTLDKEYLGLQLNIYRIACMQCYEVNIELLKGIHLRGDTRKIIDIPVNEQMAWDYINEWRKKA